MFPETCSLQICVYFRWGRNPKHSRGAVSCRDKIQPTRPPTEAKASCLLKVTLLLCAGAVPTPHQFASSTVRNWLKQEGLPCLEWLISTSCSCPSSSGSHSSCRYLQSHRLPGNRGRMKLFRIEERWPGVEPPMPHFKCYLQPSSAGPESHSPSRWWLVPTHWSRAIRQHDQGRPVVRCSQLKRSRANHCRRGRQLREQREAVLHGLSSAACTIKQLPTNLTSVQLTAESRQKVSSPGITALFCCNNAEIGSTLGVVPPLKPVHLYKAQQKTSQ